MICLIVFLCDINFTEEKNKTYFEYNYFFIQKINY